MKSISVDSASDCVPDARPQATALSAREVALSACPFCGEDPMDVPIKTEFGTAYIHCPHCGMSGPETIGAAVAVNAWNSRPAATPKATECRADGRCQYAIDHGAEGLGHCPPGKCCMPRSGSPSLDALTAKVDALLAHCHDPECSTCGVIVCPMGHPLHFHHDGCPACDGALSKATEST